MPSPTNTLFGLIFCATLLGRLRQRPPLLASLPLPLRIAVCSTTTAVYVYVAQAATEAARQAQTKLKSSPPSGLIIAFPFDRSRNPLYVAVALALVGAAVLLNSRAMGCTVLPWVLYCLLLQVPIEEAELEHVPGYREYASKTPRWLRVPELCFLAPAVLLLSVCSYCYWPMQPSKKD